jgi:hypothetical protein
LFSPYLARDCSGGHRVLAFSGSIPLLLKKDSRVTAPPCEACREGKPCLKCSHWQALVFAPSPLWTRFRWPFLLAVSGQGHDIGRETNACTGSGTGQRSTANIMAGSSRVFRTLVTWPLPAIRTRMRYRRSPTWRVSTCSRLSRLENQPQGAGTLRRCQAISTPRKLAAHLSRLKLSGVRREQHRLTTCLPRVGHRAPHRPRDLGLGIDEGLLVTRPTPRRACSKLNITIERNSLKSCAIARR